MSEFINIDSVLKKKDSNKIFIDVVDIMTLTGKSRRTSERYINKIRDFYNKKKHQPVTKLEMMDYFGFK